MGSRSSATRATKATAVDHLNCQYDVDCSVLRGLALRAKQATRASNLILEKIGCTVISEGKRRKPMFLDSLALTYAYLIRKVSGRRERNVIYKARPVEKIFTSPIIHNLSFISLCGSIYVACSITKDTFALQQ